MAPRRSSVAAPKVSRRTRRNSIVSSPPPTTISTPAKQSTKRVTSTASRSTDKKSAGIATSTRRKSVSTTTSGKRSRRSSISLSGKRVVTPSRTNTTSTIAPTPATTKSESRSSKKSLTKQIDNAVDNVSSVTSHNNKRRKLSELSEYESHIDVSGKQLPVQHKSMIAHITHAVTDKICIIM